MILIIKPWYIEDVQRKTIDDMTSSFKCKVVRPSDIAKFNKVDPKHLVGVGTIFYCGPQDLFQEYLLYECCSKGITFNRVLKDGTVECYDPVEII